METQNTHKMKTIDDLKNYFTRLPGKMFYNFEKNRFEKINYTDESICALYINTSFLDNSKFVEVSKYRITLDEDEGIPKIELEETNKTLPSFLNDKDSKAKLIKELKCELDNSHISKFINCN